MANQEDKKNERDLGPSASNRQQPDTANARRGYGEGGDTPFGQITEGSSDQAGGGYGGANFKVDDLSDLIGNIFNRGAGRAGRGPPGARAPGGAASAAAAAAPGAARWPAAARAR